MTFNAATKLASFQSALEVFVDRLREDKQILAAVLVGSLSEQTIWRRDGLFLWLVEVDGVSKRLKSDGEAEDIYRTLCEEGINVHVHLIPRSRFRKMVEGSSRTSFSCNFFAARELIYCTDKSIEKWFHQADTAARKDQERELLATTTWTIHAARHARKLLDAKQDNVLAKQTIIWMAHHVAAMEVVRAGEICEDDAIYRALELVPDLMQEIYVDVLGKKSKPVLQAALTRVEAYLMDRREENLSPLVRFLRKQGQEVPLTELANHFAYSQLYPWHLRSACDWLEEQGIVEKLTAPFKLTKKSRSDVEEPAYMLL